MDSDVFNVLGEKGTDKINCSSTKRGSNVVAVVGQRVHIDCRKTFINTRDIELELKRKNETVVPRKRSARLSDGLFVDSKTDCLFCGNLVTERSAHSLVKTETFVSTILKHCDIRNMDEWACVVEGRIEYLLRDLHAADCIYHHDCNSHFRCDRNIPLQYQNATPQRKRKCGRPKNEDQAQAFQKVCDYLVENDEEQFTMSDLVAKMTEFLSDTDSKPYSSLWLKKQLQQQFGNSIFIAEGEGLRNIVTLREKTSSILRSHFEKNRQIVDEDSQKRVIIQTAARLIKSDIKTFVPSVTNRYPSTDELRLDPALDYLPDTLQLMLSSLFAGKNTSKKVASIGQAVIQAVRPRAVIALYK